MEIVVLSVVVIFLRSGDDSSPISAIIISDEPINRFFKVNKLTQAVDFIDTCGLPFLIYSFIATNLIDGYSFKSKFKILLIVSITTMGKVLLPVKAGSPAAFVYAYVVIFYNILLHFILLNSFLNDLKK